MRAKGGRVHKQSGGAAGELDEREQGKYLRKQADSARTNADDAASVTAMGLGARMALAGTRARLGKGIANAVTGLAGLGTGANAMKAGRLRDEAKKFDSPSVDNSGTEKTEKQMGGPIMGKPVQRKIPPAVAQAIAAKRGGAGMGPPMPMRAKGGSVKMTAGAESGEGRLEKSAMARRHAKS